MEKSKTNLSSNEFASCCAQISWCKLKLMQKWNQMFTLVAYGVHAHSLAVIGSDVVSA